MKYDDSTENPMIDNAALDRYYGGAAMASGLASGRKKADTAYGATERRLYALPVLRERMEDNREELAELESCGIDALRHHSSSLVRLLRPGMRLTAEEVHVAQMAELRARLAADEREIKKMQIALSSIAGDPYAGVIDAKYFRGEHDTDVAKRLCCDPATVRRNRARLVRRLALRLYGADALL